MFISLISCYFIFFNHELRLDYFHTSFKQKVVIHTYAKYLSLRHHFLKLLGIFFGSRPTLPPSWSNFVYATLFCVGYYSQGKLSFSTSLPSSHDQQYPVCRTFTVDRPFPRKTILCIFFFKTIFRFLFRLLFCVLHFSGVSSPVLSLSLSRYTNEV